jgi:hypothetical protein
MDRIINYLLLTIIFVFDPLAIALVIAANFAFERLRPKTRENLYGETIECSVPEGREFNTPYDLDDLIPDTPYKEEEVSEVIKNEVKTIEKEDLVPINNKSKMSKLLNLKQKILQRKGSNMDKNLSQVDKKINNLREEEIKTNK